MGGVGVGRAGSGVEGRGMRGLKSSSASESEPGPETNQTDRN